MICVYICTNMFPKSQNCVPQRSSYPGGCAACGEQLKEPYVCCMVCSDLRLCVPCFAKGTEVERHISSHAYSITLDEISVLVEDWEARDERKLLDLIMECGYGNWEDIGRRLGKSPKECKEHYDTIYLYNPPEHAAELRNCVFPPPFIPSPLPPYRHRLSAEHPLRLNSSLPGYNSLRSEFDVDHDHNYPELDLALLDKNTEGWEDSEDIELFESLQVAMVDVYNHRLRERERRRRIVREHGLIVPQKNYVAMSRYSVTLGRALIEKLAPFAQLLTGMQFDYFLEGLHKSQELQERIRHLCKLRSYGLKTMHAAKLMQKLSDIRVKQSRELRANQQPLLQGMLKMEDAARSVARARRTAPPLEVNGLPYYEKLSPEERELCARVRIVPESYLEFQSLLVAECKRNYGLRLAQARRCIKIDVNKTRKLFDFLMEKGLIYPPIKD